MAASATIDIDCDARTCWELLADPLRAPRWVSGVASAEALEHDAAGRPARVRFIGMPSAASLEYVLAYAYDPERLSVSWSTVENGARSLAGEARVESIGSGRCRVSYTLISAAGHDVPVWARGTLAGDTPERALQALRRFLQRPT